MKKSPVVHFEMPYTDSKRVSKFYNAAFGWDMQDAGEDYGGYVMAVTSPMTKNNMHKSKGAINGGFYKKTKESNPYPSFVISVEDIKKGIASVKKAGGEVLTKPQEIPGIGIWVVFKDTEGNKVSMLQAKM